MKMSLTLTEEEKIKIAKWILENFEVDLKTKMVKVPTAVEGEAVLIPAEKVFKALKNRLAIAFRNGEDPWIYLANAEITPPSTEELTPCEKCGGMLRTLTPEEYFNQFLKRKVAEKLKIENLEVVKQWLE